MKTVFRIKYIVFYLLIPFSLIFCKENNEDLNKAPSPLNNVEVKNIPGGAEIHYNVPDNEDVILITVKYKTDNEGTEIIRFNIEDNPNSLVLTQLSTLKRKVELFTVNSMGNCSESVEVEIEPLLSPEIQYLNKLLALTQLEPVLGGILIDFKENVDKKKIGFNISYEEEDGKWVEYKDVIETDKETDRILIENLPYSKFKLFLSNVKSDISDTREFAVELVVESELDKSKWSNPKLPQDNWQSGPGESWGIKIENLWDNQTEGSALIRFENKTMPLPHAFSIDLGEGQALKISKIKLYNFPLKGFTYRFRHPKIIEIWGSNSPDADGGWENWTMLTVYNSIKPSNLPFPFINDEDMQYVRAGEEVRIPLNKMGAYRYIRFKTLRTWNEKEGASTESITLNEVTIWGVK